MKSELQIESLSRPVTLVNLRRRVVASIHFNNVEFFLEKMKESEPGHLNSASFAGTPF